MGLIAEYIKKYIRLNYPKLSQIEISIELGVSQNTISLYYRGLIEEGWDFDIYKKIDDMSPATINTLIQIASIEDKPLIADIAKRRLEDIFEGILHNKEIPLKEQQTEKVLSLYKKGYNKNQISRVIGRHHSFVSHRLPTSFSSVD